MVLIHKIISVLMTLTVFCLGVQTCMMAIEHQDMQITEYCINHPNEFIEGDMIINCSEWLENNPELVENCIKNNVGE